MREMSFFKDNADKKELKAKTDGILQHDEGKITKEEYMPDEASRTCKRIYRSVVCKDGFGKDVGGRAMKVSEMMSAIQVASNGNNQINLTDEVGNGVNFYCKRL